MKMGKEGEAYFIEKVQQLNNSDSEEGSPSESYYRHFQT
jgi:hypothetical protein